MTCPSLETVAAWLLGELSESDAEGFEEHYFGCDDCFGRATSLKELIAKLETAVPPLLTVERLRGLEARRPSMPTVHVEPGESATIRLGVGAPVGVWVLHCSLVGVARVDFEALSETGELFFAFQDVPFDAERGQVLLPCQLQYRELPVDRQFFARLSARDASGSRPLGQYLLNHEFENP